MNKKYILYNPYAGGGKCRTDVEKLAETYDNSTVIDMTTLDGYADFFGGLEESDEVVICGGDGTLHRFVNDTANIEIKNKVYYYAVGSGNDFVRDLGKERMAEPSFCINDYLSVLPSVTVNGEKRLFINGVGYGIDGYCCEEGDKIREENARKNVNKPINYTAIAIKGLLFRFRPRVAGVTVDGKKYTYKKVWLAPTMNGRYYGGGMIPTPTQDRADGENLSLMVFHGTGKLRTLMIFPSIFKGEHVKHKKSVEILSGKNITVEFDRPTPLQIDGETFLGVTSYTASAGVCVKNTANSTVAAS